jgi:hypothetical protein
VHPPIHPSPNAHPQRPPRRNGRRRYLWRHWRPSLAAAVVATLLAACQGAGAPAPHDVWTEAQIADVFDLSELGRAVTIAPSGDHLLLDGKALPPAVLERFPHLTMGRSANLLRFDDDALASMSSDARAFVLSAAPGELRDRLADYGLGLAALRAAWGERGTIDLTGLHAVAAELDRGAIATAGVLGRPGARLLADLGVAR